MAEEMGVHRSADSLSVHKARLSRPKIMDEAEDDEDLDMEDQPDSPAADTEVQARIDSVALAKKRMDGKKGALKGSDSEPKPAKSRFGGSRARFADDEPEAKQPAPESPTKKTPTMVTGIKNMGRKLVSRLSFGKREKQEDQTAKEKGGSSAVEISAESTHVKFTPSPAEVIPTSAADGSTSDHTDANTQ